MSGSKKAREESGRGFRFSPLRGSVAHDVVRIPWCGTTEQGGKGEIAVTECEKLREFEGNCGNSREIAGKKMRWRTQPSLT